MIYLGPKTRQLLAYSVVVVAMAGTLTYTVDKSTMQDNKIARIAAAENRDRALATQLVCQFANKTAARVNQNTTAKQRQFSTPLPQANCPTAVSKVNLSAK